MKKYIGDKRFYRMVLAVVVPIMIQNGITNFVSLLDNIMPASQRKDLTPVFSFNAQGVYVAGAQPASVDRITRWRDLLARMKQEGFLP